MNEEPKGKKDLNGTLKKITRKMISPRKISKSNIFSNRERNESSMKKNKKNNFFKKNYRKGSLDKILKSFREKSKRKTSSKRERLGFLDKVKHSDNKKQIFNQRKESQTDRFKKSIQNQYFALRKFMRKKTSDYRNVKTIQEKRNSLRKSLKNDSRDLLKEIQGPYLNKSYSINSLQSKFRLQKKKLFGDRLSTSKNKYSKLRHDDSSNLRDTRKSDRDYDLSSIKHRSSLKKIGGNHNSKTLLRRLSNNSQFLFRNEKRSSINSRASHGKLELQSLKKQVSEKLRLRRSFKLIN